MNNEVLTELIRVAPEIEAMEDDLAQYWEKHIDGLDAKRLLQEFKSLCDGDEKEAKKLARLSRSDKVKEMIARDMQRIVGQAVDKLARQIPQSKKDKTKKAKFSFNVIEKPTMVLKPDSHCTVIYEGLTTKHFVPGHRQLQGIIHIRMRGRLVRVALFQRFIGHTFWQYVGMPTEMCPKCGESRAICDGVRICTANRTVSKQ